MTLTRGSLAALVTLIIGAICLMLEPSFDWVVKWPAAWTLPITQWLGDGVGTVLQVLKPGTRLIAAGLQTVLDVAGAALAGMPWPLLLGGTTALGWYLGGLRLAALGFLGLGYVLISGYWIESMATLSLVLVSVPMAALAGLAIGILAYEVPRIKNGVQAVLDIMQTIPTFAYLTPLLVLFSFGPVVGLIASAIYAAPPMARNVLLGLERVDSDIREAAIMSGGKRWQQLFLVELPAATSQVMVGVNQCIMAALSMVIIAAVIGGFGDIGWEVLLTMRKAWFGPALIAGTVIVMFAVVMDRMSFALSQPRRSHSSRVLMVIGLLTLISAAVVALAYPDPSRISLLGGISDAMNSALTDVNVSYGASLDSVKNTAMFYGLLPMKIGLDNAVLPFTWGFEWTSSHTVWYFATVIGIGALLAWRGHVTGGLVAVIVAGMLETGIAELPWPFVLVGAAAIGWVPGGWKLARLPLIWLTVILLSGLWDKSLQSLYLSGAAILACGLLGGLLGLWGALSVNAWRVLQPICDMLQTIPLFVFLIPVIMFFQIGDFSAFLAICMYAIAPMIRYTRHGLTTTPDEMIEAAVSSGANTRQILTEVRIPYAVPSILLGLNQTILYAFAMLVIAALVGTTELGQLIYQSLTKNDVGLGLASGGAMLILALVADRLVQGFAEERRKALGL